MKKILLGSALLAASIGVASAADLPAAPVYTKAPPPPVYSWTGFYIGGSVGGMFNSNIDGSFVLPPAANWSTNQSTGVADAHAGFQYQFTPGFVLGVEGSFVGVFNNNGGSDFCHPAASCFPGTTLTGRFSNNHGIWTVGGRAGWAFNQWMPYISGGWATTRVDEALTTPLGGVVLETTRTNHSGAYFGGGVDWRVWQSLILGVEYRHYEFNSVSAVPVVAATGLPNVGDTWSLKPRADTISGRVSWLFNWGGGY